MRLRRIIDAICGLLLAATALLAQAEPDIVDVLRRSQDRRLASVVAVAADSAKAAVIRASYERVLRALQPERASELQVVRGPLQAETLHGHVIVVNESLADQPEGVRLFILAHELGHVQQQHWRAMAEVYVKWIPGEVKPELTDPIAVPLSREASRLAHQQEFAADIYAAQALRRLGRSQDDWLAVFQQPGSSLQDSPTHPSGSHRLASLRAQMGGP